MLVFIWWWFPRTYRRGIAEDNARLDEGEAQEHRERVVQNARDTIDKYRETLKQRELAKNAKAKPKKKNGDAEAQLSTPNPAIDSGTVVQ